MKTIHIAGRRTAGGHTMSQNTTAIQRVGMLAKHQLASQQKQASKPGMVKIDKPNRAQRRAAKKQAKEQAAKQQEQLI